MSQCSSVSSLLLFVLKEPQLHAIFLELFVEECSTFSKLRLLYATPLLDANDKWTFDAKPRVPKLV